MSYKTDQQLQFDLLTDLGMLQITLLPGCHWNIDKLLEDIKGHIHIYTLSHKPSGIFIQKQDNFHLIITGNLLKAINALYKRVLIPKDCKMKMVQFFMNNTIHEAIEITPTSEQPWLKSHLHKSIDSGIHSIS